MLGFTERKKMLSKTNQLAAIDVFCGVGGLTYGLKKAGIPVLAGFDIDENCKYAYEKNNDAVFISKDIRNITAEELNKFYPEDSERIMVGCAPCQTFSTHTNKIPGREKDQKWGLITEYLNKILVVNPSVVSMENVPGLTKYEIFDEFVAALKEAGYYVSYQIVYCPEYGIAQRRRRLVLLASKYGDILLIPPTHKKEDFLTVRDVIGNLPRISPGEVNVTDSLHKSSGIKELGLKRLKASKPGGNWLDWPEELRAECHKKDSGNSYKGVYARMSWDALAPTITTQFNNFGTGRFGHPEQDRALSLREGALIQTFPLSYEFTDDDESMSFSKVARMIGNAVPVRLGEVIGQSIIQHLEKYKVTENSDQVKL